MNSLGGGTGGGGFNFVVRLNNQLFLDGLLDVVLDRSVNLFNDCDRRVVFARQRYNEK